MSISSRPWIGMRNSGDINRCGSRNGSGRSSVAFTTLKIAVVAPTPTANVTMAIAVKPQFARSMRNVKRTSCPRSSSSVPIIRAQ